ncbi:MAG: hybrid sensor histidine kinase/response regulator, partial [Chloroflexi bacterium]|nr:hybrid sensor histidine kinase/response regulator [Chloroflexota bacterium]
MASVVVVDDDPIGREYVVTLLGYRGHRVIEAGDGTEALRAVREARPDLVIADVLMPAMDGLEFVRQLRAEAATASIPVVLYTAMHHQDEARALAKACGVAHVIAKPAEPETILSVVDAALAGAAAAAGDDTGWNQERATAATPHASLDAPSEPPAPPLISAAQLEDFSREHLQLLTNELAHKVRALEAMNERERAARAEAEAALRVRDEFLSIAAHELKTPLTTLLGFAQICLRQLDRHGTLDPDRARHAFEVVGAQARRLNRLVLRLLDVSRIQAGMLQIERAETNLTLLVEEVARLAQVVAPKHEL